MQCARNCGRKGTKKHSGMCKVCDREVYARAVRFIAKQECPYCEAPLARDFSLEGWWQCVASKDEHKRSMEHQHLPQCSFQVWISESTIASMGTLSQAEMEAEISTFFLF